MFWCGLVGVVFVDFIGLRAVCSFADDEGVTGDRRVHGGRCFW